ncbi:MAG: hypothetical protein AB8B80_11640 [Marinicellaceae bacterium]
MKKIDLDSYIDDKIERISYWVDKGMFNIITKHEELHFNIRAIEIDFESGNKLSIESGGSEQGLNFYNTPLDLDEWDDHAIKIGMNNHSLIKKLIGKQITDVQIWWCDNLWTSCGKRSGSKSYKQDLTISTEGNGYFLCSSAETEAEDTPSICLLDSDEIVIITNEKIAKKNELEKYGKNEFTRYKNPKT